MQGDIDIRPPVFEDCRCESCFAETVGNYQEGNFTSCHFGNCCFERLPKGRYACFPQLGILVRGLHSKDSGVLDSILSLLFLWKLPCSIWRPTRLGMGLGLGDQGVEEAEGTKLRFPKFGCVTNRPGFGLGLRVSGLGIFFP